jgi:hypothetical protein
MPVQRVIDASRHNPALFVLLIQVDVAQKGSWTNATNSPVDRRRIRVNLSASEYVACFRKSMLDGNLRKGMRSWASTTKHMKELEYTRVETALLPVFVTCHDISRARHKTKNTFRVAIPYHCSLWYVSLLHNGSAFARQTVAMLCPYSAISTILSPCASDMLCNWGTSRQCRVHKSTHCRSSSRQRNPRQPPPPDKVVPQKYRNGEQGRWKRPAPDHCLMALQAKQCRRLAQTAPPASSRQRWQGRGARPRLEYENIRTSPRFVMSQQLATIPSPLGSAINFPTKMSLKAKAPGGGGTACSAQLRQAPDCGG